MVARFGRGLLGLAAFWCITLIVGTPTVSGWLQGAYDRLAASRSGLSAESALAELAVSEEEIKYAPPCLACKSPVVALHDYSLSEFPGAVFGRAKLLLEAPRTYEAAPGSYFDNLRAEESTLLTFSATERTAGEGVRLFDEVSSSGETRPVVVTQEGYIVERRWAARPEAQAAANAASAVDAAAPVVATDTGSVADVESDADAEGYEGEATEDGETYWQRMVYQPLNPRLLKLAVTVDSTIRTGDWVVLFGDRSQSEFLAGRARNVAADSTEGIVEVEMGEDAFKRWLESRSYLPAAVTAVAESGFEMMSFRPDASEAAADLRLSVAHQRLLQNQMSAHRVLPRSALDRECSVDRAPQTACVWMLLGSEAVPIQVSVVDLAADRVGIVERSLFAGKGIAPQAWQRLSALTRRTWLQQAGEGVSILGAKDVEILATPWRR